jgi:hypothetical protein
VRFLRARFGKRRWMWSRHTKCPSIHYKQRDTNTDASSLFQQRFAQFTHLIIAMSAPSRSILITGGTSGLGYYCALEVARQRPDYSVVLVSRTYPNSAAATINKTLAQKNVVFLPLDLSNLSKISKFVQHWE